MARILATIKHYSADISSKDGEFARDWAWRPINPVVAKSHYSRHSRAGGFLTPFNGGWCRNCIRGAANRLPKLNYAKGPVIKINISRPRAGIIIWFIPNRENWSYRTRLPNRWFLSFVLQCDTGRYAPTIYQRRESEFDLESFPCLTSR